MKCLCKVISQDGDEVRLECECEGGGRKSSKRKPSKYNKFIGKCIKGLNDDRPVQEKFKECAKKYKSN